MPADYQLSPKDYLSIARRRALPIILTFGVVMTASVVVAMMLPRAYQATGTLLSRARRSQATSFALAAPGSAEQLVQALRQRIMTRESLLRIAAEHQVFDSGAGVGLKDSAVVDAMRASIDVSVLIGNMQSWERPTSNFAFQRVI